MRERIHIYNASAGSGKTFTLVKEYLKKILGNNENYSYKNILAITFTNKAVAEMKERIIANLIAFSKGNILEDPSSMLINIAEETNQSIDQLHSKSKDVLAHLLHHYASFSVDTIDRFNHQLIRTFAKDLNIATNFEVSLDTQSLLAEAVDKLIDKAGADEKITEVLLDFVLEKTDDDRSWDISKDIVKASKLLYIENEAAHVAKLKSKTLEDFSNFKKEIQEEKTECKKEVISEAKNILHLISESGLEKMDFKGGYFYNHFTKIANKNFNLKFDSKWQLMIGEESMYTAKTAKDNPHAAETIDALSSKFVSVFQKTKNHIFRLQFLDNILKNSTPLSVLNLVQQEIELIKEEKNLLPISEFNAIINKEIKNQPAPFIYERLGERYQHFFIDEFQDTSLLQWENLVPLIENAITQENEKGEIGSLLLVGDAKQSIYRWRGGLPEQFVGLTTDSNPFPVLKKVATLPSNYRSFAAIVNYNNSFFTHIASYFGDASHELLYTIGNQQKITKKEEGYVQIEFVDVKYQKDKHEVYPEKIATIIKDCEANGFNPKDICILTRKKIDGIVISEYLLSQGISILSQETLLLQYSPIVTAMVQAIKLSTYKSMDEVKVELLDFLYSNFTVSETKHAFFTACIKNDSVSFSESLQSFGIDFDLDQLTALSLYEGCEYMIRKFKLEEKIDGYVYGFLDFVNEFEQQPKTDTIGFLEYWERKRSTASVAASESLDAVQIMTIHKAKGLEFPVVIFPYADLDIYDERDAKVWFPLENNTHHFDEVLINFKKEIVNYGLQGEKLYTKRRQILELDAFNLLYVSLTRAVEQLYVISKTPSEIKEYSPTRFSQLLMSYLKFNGDWSPEKSVYSYGNKERKKEQEAFLSIPQIRPSFTASTPSNHNLVIATRDAFLWDSSKQEAIDVGNIVHDAMALINTNDDVSIALESMKKTIPLNQEIFRKLKNIIHQITTHPKLIYLFDGSHTVYNEKDIVTASGYLLRPDRVNVTSKNEAIIIDYKTGVPSKTHSEQILSYANAYDEMGFMTTEKLLIYINEETIIINKV